jgi:hypothetical protein
MKQRILRVGGLSKREAIWRWMMGNTATLKKADELKGKP